MTETQYSFIPTPCVEKNLRKRFPWIGTRPIMIPNGWLGLVHKTCQEIEAVITPDRPEDVVEYFFATVRESRLRIFFQISADFESEARSAAIKSLLNETQINCNHICYICGKESVDLVTITK